jgi:hypothetical protein
MKFAGVEALAPATIRLDGRVLGSVSVYRGRHLLVWP